MGGSESKQPAGPPPLLPEPWRSLDWGKQARDKMKKHVEELKTSVPEVNCLRILVHGPVEAGKSSFINSIDNIFQERMTSRALAETCAGLSCTIKKGDSAGVQIKDLKSILEGHINDDYKFDPTSARSENDKGYNKDPDLKDKIHCLVSVIPADFCLWCADNNMIRNSVMLERDKAIINNIRDVRRHASMVGIPQVVILSKVDEACHQVNKDIKAIYRSKVIQKMMWHCSNDMGVPLNYVFPVKNYVKNHEEIHLDMDVLLLSALTFILNLANNFVAEVEPAVAKRNSLSFVMNFAKDNAAEITLQDI